MKINWEVRIRNRLFWMSFIPAVFLVIQTVLSIFGFSINLTDMQDKILDAVNAVFVLLTVIGIVNDPTTEGLEDSLQARFYVKPKRRENRD